MREEPTAEQCYLDALFGRESDAQRQIRASAPAEAAGMMLSAHEGALLAWLARLINARHILEIGGFVGYSASWLLEALPTGGRLHCIEHHPAHAARFRHNHAEALQEGRLTLHEGKASTILPLLAALPLFDLIFIDADKAATPQYLEWAEAHLRPGGLVAVDNALRFGRVEISAPGALPPAGEAMRAANRMLAQGAPWRGMMLPTQGGLCVAQKL